MNIIVNDTNIFIDLISVGLLDAMCKLPFEIHTLDLIVAELTDPEQHSAIENYIEQNLIKLHKLSASEIISVATEHSTVYGNLSFQDVAVCHYARKGEYKLITGDRQLRKYAEKQHVEVHGIIFLIDEMVSQNVIDPEMGVEKLRNLLKTNTRLPKSEIKTRIEFLLSLKNKQRNI